MRFNIGKKEERLSSKSETQIAIQSKKKPAIVAGSSGFKISEY